MVDRTPTFSSHVQSRRFRRAVDELFMPEDVEQNDKETKSSGLQSANQPSLSLVDMKSKETVDLPSEKEDASLEKRIEALERKVADMTAVMTSLGEAFSDLQNQVCFLNSRLF